MTFVFQGLAERSSASQKGATTVKSSIQQDNCAGPGGDIDVKVYWAALPVSRAGRGLGL